jgi:hypothetical protein
MKQQIQIGKEFLVVVLFFSEAKKQYNYKRILPISRIAGTLSEFSAICNFSQSPEYRKRICYWCRKSGKKCKTANNQAAGMLR